MTPQADILLATFEGGNFLQEQLSSLFNQSYQNFHLFIRDDGSSDKTQEVIEIFLKRYPGRITQIENSSFHLGSSQNFSVLMQYSGAPYILFCDQDDIWFSEKIIHSLEKIKHLEEKYGKETPLLVHTDLEVVNASLHRIHPSFWRFSFLRPHTASSLKHLLARNVVTGCTTIFNRALCKKAFPIPSEAVQHDWWLALVANLFGKIDCLEERTLLYRQHGSNTLGAHPFRFSLFWKKLKSILKTEGIASFFRNKPWTSLHLRKQKQAEALLRRFQDEIPPKVREDISHFIDCQNTPIKGCLCSLRAYFL